MVNNQEVIRKMTCFNLISMFASAHAACCAALKTLLIKHMYAAICSWKHGLVRQQLKVLLNLPLAQSRSQSHPVMRKVHPNDQNWLHKILSVCWEAAFQTKEYLPV